MINVWIPEQTRNRIVILCFFYLLLCPWILYGQSAFGQWLQRTDSVRNERLATGKSVFTPFLAPSYAPETELMLTGGGLYSFKTNPQDSALERSSIPFSIGISTNGSILGTLRSNIYGPGNRWRANGEIWFRDMPDHYWGVGYRNAVEREQSDSITGYRRTFWRVRQTLTFHLGRQFFAGPLLDFNQTVATDINPVMAKDAYIRRQGADNRNMGFGVIFAYDSRDFGENAYRGTFLNFTLLHFDQWLGADNRYTTLEVDYRGYLPLGRERRTLAIQVRARDTFGETPWPEMSMVGSPFDLRGYYWGRFRDRFGLFGLVEYRHMFQRKRPNRKGNYQSVHGFVFWAGLGTVAPGIEEMRYWLPNAGVGYRFEVQPRMNLRVDFGIGKGASSFYVNFAEAF